MKRIGFIGSGKMAGAIIKGLLKSGLVSSENILATQASSDNVEKKSLALGVKVITDNRYLVQNSDIIFIAVKPMQVENILNEISEFITSEKIIVSVAAGVTSSKIEKLLPLNTKVVRVMPNTPALIGEGISGIYGGINSTKQDVDAVINLLSSTGKCVVLKDESQMDIVTAISGSGPAFYYKVINDIAHAGEKLGLSYEQALLLSIQTAIGSAKMALNRDKSMEELISNVATKGGCTRVGIDTMEDLNIENLLYEVIKNTTQKAKELGG